MLRFLLGRNFWSTVIRPALFLSSLSVLALLFGLLFGGEGENLQIQRTSVLLDGAYLILSATFGAWVGWGLAYWRFEEMPVGRGKFALFPLLSGVIFGPLLYWMLVEATPPSEGIEAGEKIAAIIFGAVACPFAALLTSLFWRYAPNFTALKRRKQ